MTTREDLMPFPARDGPFPQKKAKRGVKVIVEPEPVIPDWLNAMGDPETAVAHAEEQRDRATGGER